MTLSNFVSKLNWRLIVIHLIACWFFIYAFLEFSALHDLKLIHYIVHHYKDIVDHHKFGQLTVSEMYYDAVWSSLGQLLGLITAFLISLFISRKQNWYWVNSVIVLLISILSGRVWDFGW